VKSGVTIFDPETVYAPAIRNESKIFPIEIDLVIVNGEIIINGVTCKGALP
jgi:hypothetical protein